MDQTNPSLRDKIVYALKGAESKAFNHIQSHTYDALATEIMDVFAKHEQGGDEDDEDTSGRATPKKPFHHTQDDESPIPKEGDIVMVSNNHHDWFVGYLFAAFREDMVNQYGVWSDSSKKAIQWFKYCQGGQMAVETNEDTPPLTVRDGGNQMEWARNVNERLELFQNRFDRLRKADFLLNQGHEKINEELRQFNIFVNRQSADLDNVMAVVKKMENIPEEVKEINKELALHVKALDIKTDQINAIHKELSERTQLSHKTIIDYFKKDINNHTLRLDYIESVITKMWPGKAFKKDTTELSQYQLVEVSDGGVIWSKALYLGYNINAPEGHHYVVIDIETGRAISYWRCRPLAIQSK